MLQKHSKKGRQPKSAEPVVIGYQITPTVSRNLLAIETQLRKKRLHCRRTNVNLNDSGSSGLPAYNP